MNKLYLNILENFEFVKNDFTSLKISPSGVFNFVIMWVLIISVFFMLFCIGEKIRAMFFQKEIDQKINLFFNLALGYIFFGTGLAILGVLGLLYTSYILIYIFLIVLIFLSPFLNKLQKIKENLTTQLSIYKFLFSKNKPIFLIIMCFIILGFLRTLPPETGVDAIYYHTTNPRIYNLHHTLMIEPTYLFHLVTIPQLAEMYYLLADSFNQLEASRSIHYVFYLLVILLLLTFVFYKRKTVNLYAPLLFASAPLIIRQNNSAYGDFTWLLCWILSIITVSKSRLNSRSIVLAGLLFAGVLAGKLWSLSFFPMFILYFFLTLKKAIAFKYSLLFLAVSLPIPAIWYIRSIILTGNPVYPAFSNDEWFYPRLPTLTAYFLNDLLTAKISTLKNFSPLIFLGAVSFIYLSKKYFIKILNREKIHFFTFIAFIIHIIIPYSFGHYLFGLYILVSIFLSFYLMKMADKFIFVKISILFIGFSMVTYYLVNAILILPYGFGWADKDKYLSRILARDNSSYYDYEYKFSKYLHNTNTVATYGLWGFYYADFYFISIVDLFRKDSYTLSSLTKNGISKLIIKDGDMQWLCKKTNIRDCDKKKYKLLAEHSPASQYLYALSR